MTSARAIAATIAAMILALTADAGELRLTVAEPAVINRTGWPVTSGVPLPRGALHDERAAALFGEDGREIPLQAAALSHWPDGSIRWLLLDFACDLTAAQKKSFLLRYGPGTVCAAAPDPVTAREENGAAVEWVLGVTSIKKQN